MEKDGSSSETSIDVSALEPSNDVSALEPSNDASASEPSMDGSKETERYGFTDLVLEIFLLLYLNFLRYG